MPSDNMCDHVCDVAGPRPGAADCAMRGLPYSVFGKQHRYADRKDRVGIGVRYSRQGHSEIPLKHGPLIGARPRYHRALSCSFSSARLLGSGPFAKHRAAPLAGLR